MEDKLLINKRIHLQWVDCAKGIGMLLVILGHIYKDNYVNQWLYSFHIPMFFILSGYLMFGKSIKSNKEYIYKKSKSLLLPFIRNISYPIDF